MAAIQNYTTSQIHSANLETLEFFKAVAPNADPGMEALRVNALAVAIEQAGYSARALANMGPNAKPIKSVADVLLMQQMVNVRNPEGQIVNTVPVRLLLGAKPVQAGE